MDNLIDEWEIAKQRVILLKKYDGDISYRIYRYSINLLAFHYFGYSRIYSIQKGKSLIIPGLKYSLTTILLGWWSFSFFQLITLSFQNPFKYWINSMKAIDINSSGGEDVTKFVSNVNYDRKTNIVYSNINRETHTKVNKDDLEIIIELKEEFAQQNVNSYSYECVEFILEKLALINIKHLTRKDIENIFEAIRNFENNFN